MTLENIKSEQDVCSFIESCLNDFESGISTKEETDKNLHALILKLLTSQRNRLNQQYLQCKRELVKTWLTEKSANDLLKQVRE